MGQTTSLDISSEDSFEIEEDKQPPKEEKQPPKEEKQPPKEEKQPPKEEKQPPKEEKQPLKPIKARKMSTITYKEVASCIQELNEVTTGFADRTGKQLRFIIRKGTDNSIFWKRTIKIYCQKLSVSTKVIESSRQLSLRQFLRLHEEITGYISALSKKYEEFLANRNAKQEQKNAALNPSPKKVDLNMRKKSKECCVCNERLACLLLSCEHEFCDVCIDSWIRDDEYSNCPLCRKPDSESQVDSNLEQSNKLDTKDYKSEVRDYLMKLAERSKKPKF